MPLDLPFTRSALLAGVPNLRHGFSTLACEGETLNAFAARLATAQQVHKDGIRWIERFEKRAHEADAIGTQEAGLAVGVYTADCSPLLYVGVDKNKQALALLAVHAGWRGCALGIAAKALDFFAAKLPAHTNQILVAIGPSISKAAFEVGPDVVAAFPGAEKNGIAVFRHLEGERKKYFFDLPGENKRQLENTPTRWPLQIDLLPDCTFTQKALYPSYRREQGKTGRILSFLEITQ